MNHNYSYLAGFFDADGTVGVTNPNLHTQNAFRLRLRVSQTSMPVLSMFKAAFGGSIAGGKKPTPQAKTAWCWSITGPKAIIALEVMLPFLVVKRERVEVALQWKKLVQCVGGNGHTRNRKREREALFQRMKKLNLRGVPQ